MKRENWQQSASRRILIAWCVVVISAMGQYEASSAELRFRIVDAQGELLPSRIHLYRFDGSVVRPDNVIFFRDHFVCEGAVTIDVDEGLYRYEIERGHEYRPVVGEIMVENGGENDVRAELSRMVDMKTKGWYSGELHIHRPLEHLEVLMKADDLHVGPSISWWNRNSAWQNAQLPESTTRSFDNGRFLDVMSGEDEREGGALMFFGLDRPLPIQEATREFPSPMEFVELAHQRNEDVWIDIEKPFWWDVPVWAISGKVHSIGIANNHMCRSSVLANEAWGRPRSEEQFPGPTGNGYWTQHIYYQLLNSGIRIPPSAGSASGVLPNPVGFNRAYVYIDGDWTLEKWWEGLRRGESFMTNGPLLDIRVNDELPGHTFTSNGADSLSISITGEVISNVAVASLELVHNGSVVESFTCEDGHWQEIDFEYEFDSHGWFLIRAKTTEQSTFRFASTAPYFLSTGDNREYISRSSINFFVDWIDERIERIRANMEEGEQRDSVIEYQLRARELWVRRLERANAD